MLWFFDPKSGLSVRRGLREGVLRATAKSEICLLEARMFREGEEVNERETEQVKFLLEKYCGSQVLVMPEGCTITKEKSTDAVPLVRPVAEVASLNLQGAWKVVLVPKETRFVILDSKGKRHRIREEDDLLQRGWVASMAA